MPGATSASGQAFQILDARAEHFFQVYRLPWVHRDPFDRLIAAQAQVEGLPVVTDDGDLQKYPDLCIIW